MSKQEILNGIDKTIDVLLTYEQDEETKKLIQALNEAWEIVNNNTKTNK